MAYTPANLVGQPLGIGGAGNATIWHYTSTDVSTDVDATDYFTDGDERGMKIHDPIFVVDSDTGPTGTWHMVTVVTAGGAATVSAAL